VKHVVSLTPRFSSGDAADRRNECAVRARRSPGAQPDGYGSVGSSVRTQRLRGTHSPLPDEVAESEGTNGLKAASPIAGRAIRSARCRWAAVAARGQPGTFADSGRAAASPGGGRRNATCSPPNEVG